MTMKNNPVIPPKAPNEMYTDGQWQAIYDQGDNLLVSASAGSGKTAVLVRRVIEKIKRDHVSVDQLLVVTFTEAAAAEMKERIQTALQEAINEENDQELKNHFTRQLALLPMANISTLHAFCSKVIQRFFYLIELDPSYRMLTDETETILLKEDVWDELRELCYTENETIFYQLTENFSSDRSDEGLTDLILALYEFARANPAPFEWLDSLVENYEVTSLADSKLYQTGIKPELLHKLAALKQTYTELVGLAENAAELKKARELVQTELQFCLSLSELLEQDQLEEAYAYVQQLSFARFAGATKKSPEEVKELSDQIKDARAANKKVLDDWRKTGFFALPPSEQLANLQAAVPLVSELVRVEKLYLESYSAKKREKGLLDFNDLEHFTLAILQHTEAKDYYQSRFTEVLVDEYQDTNQLQETILQQLTKGEVNGNLFMVGDVKQSIYGFRLADPTLFIEKYHRFADADGGRRIILAENFRSRSDVLDFTNLVFKQLMDPTVGQIEYDQEAELINGFTGFPSSEQFQTELLIYEKGKEAPAWIEDKTMGEVYLTALKIRELVDQGFEIYDKKQKMLRPVSYEDIVLLVPTKSNNLTILEVFKQLDIPLEINDTQNYFQTTELQLIISLLQIIDNPYQDIPLAAVLRSPIAGLSEEELAEIRIYGKNLDFYRASMTYANEQQDPISEKLTEFYAQLGAWREFARRESLADLLWKIYNETAYLDYVLGMPAGTQRHANLLALVDRAESYEKTSFRGLYQFIRFIEKMQEKDKDLGEPQKAENVDAVRVMTIHGSKGLEFPLVFLMDSTKQFNTGDLDKKYIFDEKLGLGIKLLTPQRVQLDTLAYGAVRNIKKQKLLSEELRKLYVALTRAEQKLFIVGSYDEEEKAFASWKKAATIDKLILPPDLRDSTAGSYLDWIGKALFRHPIMANFQHEFVTAKIPELEKDATRFNVTFVEPQVIDAKRAEIVLPVPENKIIADLKVEDLITALNFRYPFEEAITTTSYQSVSELKRIYDDPDNKEAIPLTLSQTNPQTKYRFTEDSFDQPKFLQQTELSATEVGTATHLVMQLLPLANGVDEKSLAQFIARLVDQKTLVPELAAAINQTDILAFFETQLGQSLIKEADKLAREEPFAMLLPAKTIFKDYQAADQLLVHGIIDGYLEFSDHIILYDFKTDHYSQKREPALLERYRGQLFLYKEALEKAKQKPVTSLNLIFLSGHQNLDLLDFYKD